jgi:hypothetical protein
MEVRMEPMQLELPPACGSHFDSSLRRDCARGLVRSTQSCVVGENETLL